MSIKLFELNIRHGGGKRIPQILKRIIGYNVDVIVLTEFRHNQNSDTIKNKLLDEGYRWQTTVPESRRTNTVFIASRLHFESVPLIDLPVECTEEQF
ncbi:MAG: endonuclease/exonuclease/phosphatase family protein [Ignavibacteria bacterium]|jgi:hypothetical protein|nr:endonuclease/exonuclease/phosphatase family protein [Ignavibacteria bacterium]MCU7519626.1 endonuclease/exonuclease/phosphatase family protein [Ignavibacteria bacterium]